MLLVDMLTGLDGVHGFVFTFLGELVRSTL